MTKYQLVHDYSNWSYLIKEILFNYNFYGDMTEDTIDSVIIPDILTEYKKQIQLKHPHFKIIKCESHHSQYYYNDIKYQVYIINTIIDKQHGEVDADAIILQFKEK